MTDFWGGAIVKHYLGTGDIANHLYVISVEPIDVDAFDNILEDGTAITQVGKGSWDYLVTVGFLPIGTEVAYQYIVSLSFPSPRYEDFKNAIAEHIANQHNH